MASQNIEQKFKALETPTELATRIGIPVSSVRRLIKSGFLDHIFISEGRRNPKIPAGSWERYVADRTIRAKSPQSSSSIIGDN